MGKAIALSGLVAGVLTLIGVCVAFVTMVALNGFGERQASRIMLVLAALFFAAFFAIVRKVAVATLPEAERGRARVIASVLTALPALPTFGMLLMLS